MGEPGIGALVPAAHDPRFARVFMWYARRLALKRFHAARLAIGSSEVARAGDRSPAPLVVVISHGSWWDPLIALLAGRRLLAERTPIAPIDSVQLEKFRFFRKLGLFGIDPDDPASMRSMLEYATTWLKAGEKRALAVTAQGRFADPREPVVPRPGAAAVCARLGGPSVLSLAIEYAFWQDQRPEVFMRFASITLADGAAGTTADWHRAIQGGMQQNADALARLVIVRDPAAFEPLFGRERAGAAINPVYDMWLRLRGKRAAIEAQRGVRGATS
jgi:1-acyl-sn-glycerol-3-phosphate acyltransferase